MNMMYLNDYFPDFISNQFGIDEKELCSFRGKERGIIL